MPNNLINIINTFNGDFFFISRRKNFISPKKYQNKLIQNEKNGHFRKGLFKVFVIAFLMYF